MNMAWGSSTPTALFYAMEAVKERIEEARVAALKQLKYALGEPIRHQEGIELPEQIALEPHQRELFIQLKGYVVARAGNYDFNREKEYLLIANIAKAITGNNTQAVKDIHFSEETLRTFDVADPTFFNILSTYRENLGLGILEAEYKAPTCTLL